MNEARRFFGIFSRTAQVLLLLVFCKYIIETFYV
jgi:hypothetical protein